MTHVLAVDLGKTGCRTRLTRDGAVVAAGQGPGARGLAEPGGDGDATEAILGAAPAATSPSRLLIGVGAAGASAAPETAQRLARLLADELDAAAVAVTTDAVTAHVGALGGAPGVVVAAGTGAVAVGVAPGGAVRLVDGWGQWLGDEGGGSWVGRAGLRAVTRAIDGRGPATGLTALAEARFGDLDQLPAALAAGGNVARATASFGPDVVAAADTGDGEALRVLREAASGLAESARVAAMRTGTSRVALVGGLRHWGEALLRPWREALGPDLEVVEPLGSALDGAALLATRTDLPHETHVHRHVHRHVQQHVREEPQ